MGWVADYRRAADWLLARYPLADLQAASLFNAKGYFRLYRHRLLIPYRLDSQVLGLQARDTEWSKDRGGPKELTLGPVAIPFNADALLGEPGQVFITEGAIDCLSLIEQGFSAVAIPGAGNFRREWVGLFEGWDVLLALDADPAGRAATDRIARLFNAAGQTVRVLELPAGSDINDLLTAA
jgi:DNA primase